MADHREMISVETCSNFVVVTQWMDEWSKKKMLDNINPLYDSATVLSLNAVLTSKTSESVHQQQASLLQLLPLRETAKRAIAGVVGPPIVRIEHPPPSSPSHNHYRVESSSSTSPPPPSPTIPHYRCQRSRNLTPACLTPHLAPPLIDYLLPASTRSQPTAHPYPRCRSLIRRRRILRGLPTDQSTPPGLHPSSSPNGVVRTTRLGSGSDPQLTTCIPEHPVSITSKVPLRATR
ncbi:hypothetical protein EDC01DRAFT_635131 [Geopyxis carbonaria]|nr:hypothetical protein EDC01DRAFT_635131 [Geopyxis carbonaria]